MKTKFIFILLYFIMLGFVAVAQDQAKSEVATDESIEKIRTQSGVDPTRVTSRVSYSALFYGKQNAGAQINNRLSMTLGVNRWSFQLKAEAVSINTVPSGGFVTGFGDLHFTVLNAFYVKDRNALAASVEFGLPTASDVIARPAGMGGYFYATPSLTWSYTINPSLMLALQPQYSFAIARNPNYPRLNVAILRMFIAKFTKTGYFFVLEPRPMYDFTQKQFDVVISPIIGKNIGGGYNVVLLGEIPINRDVINRKGWMVQFGLSKNF